MMEHITSKSCLENVLVVIPAKQKISEEKEKLVKAEAAFLESVEYFRWESREKKASPFNSAKSLLRK